MVVDLFRVHPDDEITETTGYVVVVLPCGEWLFFVVHGIQKGHGFGSGDAKGSGLSKGHERHQAVTC